MSALLKASTFSPSVLALATNKKQSLRQRKQSSNVVVSASAGVGQGTSLRFLLSRDYDYDFCSVIHSRGNQLISPMES